MSSHAKLLCSSGLGSGTGIWLIADTTGHNQGGGIPP